MEEALLPRQSAPDNHERLMVRHTFERRGVKLMASSMSFHVRVSGLDTTRTCPDFIAPKTEGMFFSASIKEWVSPSW